MQDVEPGLIRCELHYKAKHKAWVDIPYSLEGYSIIYVRSEYLRYQPSTEDFPGETINGNYNYWIRDLDLSIQAELGKALWVPERTGDSTTSLLRFQGIPAVQLPS